MVVTATATSAHGFTVGDTILLTIAGATPSGYNGTFLCTITTTTAFTYALATNPGTMTVAGVYTVEDVAELTAMATTFFAQGSTVAVYVLELGPGSPADGVTALTAYITANPNSNYTPGAAGYFYSYLLPRAWSSEPTFITMLASYEETTGLTYFFTTATLANYKSFTPLMKDAVVLIEAPQTASYSGNTLTALAWSSGEVTATTTTAHGVAVGDWFQIVGCTPTGYNGYAQAVLGTTGSTLIWNLASNPGAESALGSLVASPIASYWRATTEFSLAAPFWTSLHYAPSTTNQVTPFAFSAAFGVTPFPNQGNSAILTALKTAGVNVIGTGSEGGLTSTFLFWGTTMDGRDFTYWYSVDWAQLNLNLDLSNEVINGSNNPQAPLYYNQNGINRLSLRATDTMNRGVAYGLVLPPVTVTAVPFAAYVATNESDYKTGTYKGIGVTFTPQRGFISITINVDVTDFPTG